MLEAALELTLILCVGAWHQRSIDLMYWVIVLVVLRPLYPHASGRFDTIPRAPLSQDPYASKDSVAGKGSVRENLKKGEGVDGKPAFGLVMLAA